MEMLARQILIRRKTPSSIFTRRRLSRPWIGDNEFMPL